MYKVRSWNCLITWSSFVLNMHAMFQLHVPDGMQPVINQWLDMSDEFKFLLIPFLINTFQDYVFIIQNHQ